MLTSTIGKSPDSPKAHNADCPNRLLSRMPRDARSDESAYNTRLAMR